MSDFESAIVSRRKLELAVRKLTAECELHKAQLRHAEASADQAIHNEAFVTALAIAQWLRTVTHASGVPLSIEPSQDIARLADDIEKMNWR